MRKITYAQAINEALDQSLAQDKRVFVIGEGVPDAKGIFGTTINLQKKYGAQRVMDMPLSENGITGVCTGAALYGMRPVMVHQRIDFSLLAFDQIANVAAKWYYMFGSTVCVPLTILVIIGRGWGQGSQHSQSLQTLFAHIPGLKVVMPTFPTDAKGMLISAIQDKNPVIFIEHRWLHNISESVPERYYTQDISQPKLVRKGKDITVVATSYMVLECLKVIQFLKKLASIELIDMRVLKPFNDLLICESVKKTKRLIVADTGVSSYGFASEVISRVSEKLFNQLKSKPVRITLPDIPTPTSFKLAEKYYPSIDNIAASIMNTLNIEKRLQTKILSDIKKSKTIESDIPDSTFSGPF